MATVTLRAENDHPLNNRAYEIDTFAASELRAATTAGKADEVFERLAPHVPAKDRLGVWVASSVV